MSNSSNRYSSTSFDAAIESTKPRRSNPDFAQQPSSTPAPSYGQASLLTPSNGLAVTTTDPPSMFRSTSDQPWGSNYGQPSASLSPNRCANQIVNFPRGFPSTSGPESAFDFGQQPTYGQSSTLGGPSSFGQPQSMYSEPPSASLQPTQSLNATSFGAPQPEPPSFGYSGAESIQVMFATTEDLDEIAEIHGRTLLADPIARNTLKRDPIREDPTKFNYPAVDDYIEVGYWHYDQAFADHEADVLIAVERTSQRIVGCAWLKLFASREEDVIDVNTPCRSGFSLPSAVKISTYTEVRRNTEYDRFSTLKGAWVPHYFIRALDVRDTVPLLTRKLIHRKLVSYVSQIKPYHALYAHQLTASEMTSFQDEGWLPTGEAVVNVNIRDITLTGWFRPAVLAVEDLVAEPVSSAEMQTLPSQASFPPAPPIQTTSLGPLTDQQYPAIGVNHRSPMVSSTQAHNPNSTSKVLLDLEEAQSVQQHAVLANVQFPFLASPTQRSLGNHNFSVHSGETHQQNSRCYHLPPSQGSNHQQPLEQQQFQHAQLQGGQQYQQYQQYQQGQPAQIHEQPQPYPPILPTTPPQQSLESQETDGQVVSVSPDPPVSHPTITIHLITDAVRSGPCFSPLKHDTYTGISLTWNVKFLIRMFRSYNKAIKGLQMMAKCGKKKLKADNTRVIWDNKAVAKKLLADYGWGAGWDPVWMAATGEDDQFLMTTRVDES